jgi:hypothetical protein
LDTLTFGGIVGARKRIEHVGQFDRVVHKFTIRVDLVDGERYFVIMRSDSESFPVGYRIRVAQVLAKQLPQPQEDPRDGLMRFRIAEALRYELSLVRRAIKVDLVLP